MLTAPTSDARASSAPTLQQLRGCVLFRDFTDAELQRLLPLLAERRLAPGTTIVSEGDAATEIFVVRTGLVEVTKRAAAGGTDHRLTTLGAGTTFGEMTLIDRAPRSASVRTLEPTTVAVLSMADLDAAAAADVGLRARMLHNLSLHLAGRLRGVSEVTATALENELALARTRVAMGTFLTYVMVMMVAYAFAMRVVSDLTRTAADTTIVSVPMILGFALPLVVMMRRSGEPMATYGLTWRGGRRAALDAIVWTLPVLALTVLLKLVLIRNVPSLGHLPLFTMGGWGEGAPAASVWFTFLMSLAYLVVVPLQEVVARGALQSSLARFFAGPDASLRAVVVANLLFTASHLYLSTTFAVISMIPGFLWGWLYARHGTLVAPIVSHAMVGWWGLFVLGFDRLLV